MVSDEAVQLINPILGLYLQALTDGVTTEGFQEWLFEQIEYLRDNNAPVDVIAAYASHWNFDYWLQK